jgi:hypothetical protein
LAAALKAFSDCLRQSSAFCRNSSAVLIVLAELIDQVANRARSREHSGGVGMPTTYNAGL